MLVSPRAVYHLSNGLTGLAAGSQLMVQHVQAIHVKPVCYGHRCPYVKTTVAFSLLICIAEPTEQTITNGLKSGLPRSGNT